MIDRRPFAETHPHLVGFMDFLDDFNRETERGAALAAAAMIDDQLGKIIAAFLVPNKVVTRCLPVSMHRSTHKVRLPHQRYVGGSMYLKSSERREM